METGLTWGTPMLVSAVVFLITFIGIFTESLHHIHRTKVAMIGAAFMVLCGQYFGFYNPELALEAIDWNVVFLLGAMMTVIAIMIPTGGFQALAYAIARFSKGRLTLLLVLLGTVVTLISCMLDNVTTVIIFGPLIILICQALSVNPIPFLMGAALLANTGGVATVVGDPTAMMISSSAKIDFMTWLFRMSGIVIACWLTILFVLRFLFRDKFKKVPQEMVFSDTAVITDKKTWYASLGVLTIMVVLFFIHGSMHWEPWVVAVLGLTMLIGITYKANLEKYLAEIELTLLLFFVSLFVLIGGVENSQFLEYMAGFVQPFVEKDMLTACIMVIWVTGFLSAVIDNIPFTAAMIPILLGMEEQGVDITPLWWSLAVGAGIGGNGSHLGATANIFIVSLTERMAKQENKPSLAITPVLWLKRGTPIMIAELVTASICMYLFFHFYASPLPVE